MATEKKSRLLSIVLIALCIMIAFGTVLTIVEIITSVKDSPEDYMIYLATTLLAYIMIIVYTVFLYKLPGRHWLVLLIVMVAIYQAWIIVKTIFFESLPIPVYIIMGIMLLALLSTAIAPDHRSKIMLVVAITQTAFSVFGCITGAIPEYVSVPWLFKIHWFALPVMEFCIFIIFMNKKSDKAKKANADKA